MAVRYRPFLILFILGIAASWAALQLYEGCPYENARITGTVYREVWNKEDQAVLDPDDQSIRILLIGSGVGAYPGRKILVQGRPQQPETARNPGGYSQRDYLYGKNVLLVMEAEYIEVLPDAALNVRAVGSRIRAQIEATLSEYMDGEDMGFLLGVMTGDTGGLDDSEKDWVRLSGISHLMAVSGMHVTYILMPVKCLVKRKKLDIALRSGLCLVPLALFTVTAGFTPSVIRAAVMSGCSLVARIVNRKNDFLNTFGLAGCICLLVYPMGVADTGFVLSFGAVLSGYALSAPVTKLLWRKDRRPGAMLNALCRGLAVNIGLLPVMLYRFHLISPAGVLISMAAAPLSAAMCVLGYFTCITGSVPFLRLSAEITSQMLTAVTEALAAVAGTGAGFPVVRTVSPPVWLLCIYYGSLWWLIWGKRYFTGKRLLAAAGAFAVACAATGISGRAPVRIIWFDVGQGSCALISTAEGRHMLIDGGNGYTDISGLLWKNGVSFIDCVVLSHGDADHCEGLRSVIQEHAVGSLVISDNPEDENTVKLAEEAKALEIETVSITGTAAVALSDSVRAELYSRPVKGSFNNSSVVVQLITDFGCVLFPGDLEQEGERAMAEDGFLKPCEIVTAAHHGAARGTGTLLLESTKPYFAVISVGSGNLYGHPTEAVLERLQTHHIKVLRTDRDGAVIISYGADGTIGVEKWLQREKLQYRK